VVRHTVRVTSRMTIRRPGAGTVSGSPITNHAGSGLTLEPGGLLNADMVSPWNTSKSGIDNGSHDCLSWQRRRIGR
jgi:hypothetical protein